MSHSHPLSSGLVFLALTAAGCLVQSEASDASPGEQSSPLVNATMPAGTNLNSPPEARLFFDPGWQEGLYETAYAGGKLRIIASPDRFPRCGVNGKVVAFVRVDGGKTTSVAMKKDANGWPGGSLTLPSTARSFEVWLRSQEGSCEEYDSAFGKNYRFEAHAWKPTVVHFNADWSEKAEGVIDPEGVLVIDFDPARLPNCRATDKYGLPVWDIIAHVRWSTGGEAAQSVVVGESSYGAIHEKTRGLALFPLPAGVKSLELWFENTTGEVNYSPAPQCHEWDSDFEKNYGFAVGE